MTTKTKFNTTNNDAGQLASIEGHAVPSSFPSSPRGPLSFTKESAMKARKYYSLIAIFDTKWEILFGDYDREVVEQEKEDNENLDSDFGAKKLKIITTGDAQDDIDVRVRNENIKLSEKKEDRTDIILKHEHDHEVTDGHPHSFCKPSDRTFPRHSVCKAHHRDNEEKTYRFENRKNPLTSTTER
jgi:hypothetical protein